MITVHNAGWFDIICETHHENHDNGVVQTVSNTVKLNLGQTHTFDHKNQRLIIYANKLNSDLAIQKVQLKRISDVTAETYGIIAHGTAFNPWLEYNK